MQKTKKKTEGKDIKYINLKMLLWGLKFAKVRGPVISKGLAKGKWIKSHVTEPTVASVIQPKIEKNQKTNLFKSF